MWVSSMQWMDMFSSATKNKLMMNVTSDGAVMYAPAAKGAMYAIKYSVVDTALPILGTNILSNL